MPEEEDLIRKINAILRKAESTDNVHEADAFYTKAHEMMVRYAIEEERVRKAHFGNRMEEPLVEDYMFSSYAHHSEAKSTLLEVVAETHSVRSMMYSNRKDSNHERLGNRGLHESQWTRLIGYKSDIEHVKILYLSLLIQSQKFANDDWRDRYGADAKHSSFDDGHVGKFTWISSHMNGFADRIGRRFKELTQAIYDEVPDSSALILDKDANILEWMYEHGILRRPKPSVYYCWTPEPEENRPYNADGRTLSKKWRPKYCLIEVQVEPVTYKKLPHEGEHKFTYTPATSGRYSTYVAKGRSESYEARSAGRAAAERADIGLTRTTSGAQQIKP